MAVGRNRLAKTALAKIKLSDKTIVDLSQDLRDEIEATDVHGVVSGMDISLHPTDASKFLIGSGVYYINGTRVEYSGGEVETVTILGGQFASAIIDTGGNVSLLSNTFPSIAQLNDGYLELTAFSKTDVNTINRIGESFFESIDFMKKVYIRHKFFEGTIFSLDAGQITTTGLNVNIQGGDINTPDAVTKTITTDTSISGQLIYRVGGVYQIQPEATISLNNTQYDNGDLTALSNNKYVVHTIARSSRTNTVYVIIGDTEYNKEEDAIEADYNLGIFAGVQGSEIEPLANLVIEKDSTTVASIVDLRNGIKVTTTSLATVFDSRLTDLEVRVTALENA